MYHPKVLGRGHLHPFKAKGFCKYESWLYGGETVNHQAECILFSGRYLQCSQNYRSVK